MSKRVGRNETENITSTKRGFRTKKKCVAAYEHIKKGN